MRRLLLGVIVIALGCSSTVAAEHPQAAAYAREDVPGRHQDDVRLVLAVPEDDASRAALGCILAYAHGVRVRDARIENAKMNAPTTGNDRSPRPPAMPPGTSPDDPEDACKKAQTSRDPRIKAIGERYERAAAAELSPSAVRATLGSVVLDDVQTLLDEGNDNLAYRKLQGLLATAPTGAVGERAAALVAANRPRLLVEEAFEALADVRVLRRQEQGLTAAVRERQRKGELLGRIAEDLRDVRELLAEKHAAFVARRP